MKTLRTKKQLFEIGRNFKKELEADGMIFTHEERIYVPVFEEDGSPSCTYTKDERHFNNVPVVRFNELYREKFTIDLDARRIEGDYEFLNDELKSDYNVITNTYYRVKKAIKNTVENLIGVEEKREKKGFFFDDFKSYENDEEISSIVEKQMNELGYLKEHHEKIQITKIGKGSSVLYEIAIHDTGRDDFGDICSNEWVVIFIDNQRMYYL